MPTVREIVSGNHARVQALLARHAEIEQKLREERAFPAANDLGMKSLKKQKLRLKEEIEGLRGAEAY